MPTQFAVDLDNQLQGVLNQCAFIQGWPRRVDDGACMAQFVPQLMADMRSDRGQYQCNRFKAFLQQCAVLFSHLRCFFKHVHHGHHLGDGGVEFVMQADVLARLLDRLVDSTANDFLFVVQAGDVQRARQTLANVGIGQTPYALEEAVRTFNTRVGPFQARVRWRGKHHEQAAGVCAVLLDHVLRVDAVVLGLGHFFSATDFNGQAVADQFGADDLGFAVTLQLDVCRVEPGQGAVGFATVVSLGNHHALGQQVLERLVGADKTFVTHQLVEEARVQQVQDGVFDTADVLVNRQPVVSRRFLDQAAFIVRGRVTGVVPRGLDEGVHRVGFAFGRCATFRAAALIEFRHARQWRAGAIGHDVFWQDDGQLVFRDRNVTAGVAVHDRDRAAPVALAADAPVTQAELGTRLAKAFGGQGGFDGSECRVEIQAVEFAGVDQRAVLVVGVLPRSR